MKRVNICGKIMDTHAIRHRIIQGEKNAETVEFYLPPFCGKVDLSQLSYTILGKTGAGTSVKALAAQKVPEGLVLRWQIESDFTAVAGPMELTLCGTDADGHTIIKFVGCPVEVKPNKHGTAPPAPDVLEQAFSQMQVLLSQTQAAASRAESVIPKGGRKGHVLMKASDADADTVWAAVSGGGSGQGTEFTAGEGLKWAENPAGAPVLLVDTASAVEAGNHRPVSSDAVYTQLGNINALLHSI